MPEGAVAQPRWRGRGTVMWWSVRPGDGAIPADQPKRQTPKLTRTDRRIDPLGHSICGFAPLIPGGILRTRGRSSRARRSF